MRTINERKISEVLAYIKEFQKNEGRSPSFRQIAKAVNLNSLATAQKYINVLQTRNLIKRNDQGCIMTPYKFNMGKTIIAPLVGNVACGSPILAEENIEGTYQLPTSIFGNDNKMLLHAQGDSMVGAGIHDGDLLVVDICNKAENGDIVVACINDSATVKRFYKKQDKVILHPENPKYNDIETKDLIIQGIVKHVIHSF